MKGSKAIVNDRRVKIMRLIEEKRSVSVDELVEKYHVSPITIRRDLQYWEDKGAIIRNYGGASLIQEFVEDEEYERTDVYKRQVHYPGKHCRNCERFCFLDVFNPAGSLRWSADSGLTKDQNPQFHR